MNAALRFDGGHRSGIHPPGARVTFHAPTAACEDAGRGGAKHSTTVTLNAGHPKGVTDRAPISRCEPRLLEAKITS